MKLRLLSTLLALLFLTTIIIGCGAQTPATQSPPPGSSSPAPASPSPGGATGNASPPIEDSFKKITVGTMALSMGVAVQYAFEKGFFEEEGLEVEILLFPTGVPINEAYAAGQLDIAVSGMASVYSLANGRAKWIGEINSTGGLGVFVRPDSPVLSAKGQIPGKPNMYGNADLLRGLTVIGPLGTASQFNMIRWAQQFGLSPSNYNHVHMEFGAGYQAFLSGEGDAVTLNPPFSFQALDQGFVLAASFEDATETLLMDGMFCTVDMYENRREELVRFVRSIYRAQADLQDYNTRFDFSLRWFNESGREYTPESLAAEIAARDYIFEGSMTGPGYTFGKGMTEIAGFLITTHMIRPRDFPNVQASFAPDIIFEALGIQFEVDK